MVLRQDTHDAAPLRGAAEVAALGDRDKILEIAQGKAGEGQTGTPRRT